MQWRALVLLFSGLGVIYLAVQFQETPRVHPRTIYTSNHPRVFSFTPDKLILSTVGSYIYLTAVKFEVLESKGSLIGTGNLKLGVQGYVKQIRKPISNLLTERDVLEIDGWTTCFEHELKGPITKISEKDSQFAILYHQVENENSYHYVRIYYTTTLDDDIYFEYKDILLPGTTWVDAISLENNSILYSRDPDPYEFHIMTLPSTLYEPPHAILSTDYTIEHGRLVQEWSQPMSTEDVSSLLLRLYSPVKETYRVFSLHVHKTTTMFYVNITITDNTTITNDGNEPVSTWIQRERGESKYPVYNDDTVGFSDVSTYQITQHVEQPSMPELHAAVSPSARTVVFPYVKNKFITIDYTDRIDILSQIESERVRLFSNDGRKTIIPEYYYWQGYETVNADIMGLKLDEEGDALALWTENNYVYIYGRNKSELAEKSMNRFDRMVSYLLTEMPEEEKQLRQTYFPLPWRLSFAIPPTKDAYGRTKAIGTIHFWNDQVNNASYFFVGLKDGNVNSYRIDQQEPHRIPDFWSFANDRWDMLLAMCMVISIFVYNENQR